MKNGNRVLNIAALLAVLCGLLWSIQSSSSARTTLSQIRTKAEDYDRLVELRKAAAGQLAAVETFESLAQKRPTSLANIVRSSTPGVEAQVRQRDSRPAASGWTLLRVDVTFEDVQLPVVGQFLRSAGEARPPWRMAECNIIASHSEPGRGKALLVMEALEKTE